MTRSGGKETVGRHSDLTGMFGLIPDISPEDQRHVGLLATSRAIRDGWSKEELSRVLQTLGLKSSARVVKNRNGTFRVVEAD